MLQQIMQHAQAFLHTGQNAHNAPRTCVRVASRLGMHRPRKSPPAASWRVLVGMRWRVALSLAVMLCVLCNVPFPRNVGTLFVPKTCAAHTPNNNIGVAANPDTRRENA